MQDGGHSGHAAGKDLPPLGDEFAEQLHIAEIDGVRVDVDSPAGGGAIHTTGAAGFFIEHDPLLLGFGLFLVFGLLATFLLGRLDGVHERLGAFPAILAFVFLLEAGLAIDGETGEGDRF